MSQPTFKAKGITSLKAICNSSDICNWCWTCPTWNDGINSMQGKLPYQCLPKTLTNAALHLCKNLNLVQNLIWLWAYCKIADASWFCFNSSLHKVQISTLLHMNRMLSKTSVLAQEVWGSCLMLQQTVRHVGRQFCCSLLSWKRSTNYLDWFHQKKQC